MDTKILRLALAPLQELARTNKFKRSLDIAFGQGIPVEIKVAAPFKCFVGKTGKRFKVKIRNTKTGEARLLCSVKIEKHAERREWSAKGTTYVGFTREDVIAKSGELDPKDVTTWASSEEVISSTGWAEIGFAVSKLFKSDMVYFSTCGRCSGVGFIPAFAHVYGGICFECLGTGGLLAVGENLQYIKK